MGFILSIVINEETRVYYHQIPHTMRQNLINLRLRSLQSSGGTAF